VVAGDVVGVIPVLVLKGGSVIGLSWHEEGFSVP
jgi:hypothetical protein